MDLAGVEDPVEQLVDVSHQDLGSLPQAVVRPRSLSNSLGRRGEVSFSWLAVTLTAVTLIATTLTALTRSSDALNLSLSWAGRLSTSGGR